MSMQDPIADLLTRIRNAQAIGDAKISLPASKLKKAILKVMKDEGYVSDFESQIVAGKGNLTVRLAYYQGKPVISKIKRISKVGLRVYSSSRDIPVVCSGMGISIVSTPQGVMTGHAAKLHNLGGEVLCTVE